jgi:hypothetical protein
LIFHDDGVKDTYPYEGLLVNSLGAELIPIEMFSLGMVE